MLRFLLGLGLGYGIGLIIAPAPGEQIRSELMQRGEEKLADVVQIGRQRAGEIARDAAEQGFDKAAEKAVGPDVVDRSRMA